MHAIDRRRVGVGQQLGHPLVCQQHQLFDHRMRGRLAGGTRRGDTTIGERELDLTRVDAGGAALEAGGSQPPADSRASVSASHSRGSAASSPARIRSTCG